jgi:hypothetical protein
MLYVLVPNVIKQLSKTNYVLYTAEQQNIATKNKSFQRWLTHFLDKAMWLKITTVHFGTKESIGLKGVSHEN